MAMGSSTRAGSHSAINVTPLIDVLLVLLIIFMVIQPAVLHGLRAAAPAPSKNLAAEPSPQTIVLQVNQSSAGGIAYRINERLVRVEDLSPALQAIFAGRGEPVLFVRGDAGLDYAAVLHAIDAAHDAGVQTVGVLTTPQS